MEKKILLIVAIFVFIQTSTYAINVTEETIKEQQETFGISDFVKETEKYTDDFFNDINISDMIDNAITGEIDNSTLLNKIIKLTLRKALTEA